MERFLKESLVKGEKKLLAAQQNGGFGGLEKPCTRALFENSVRALNLPPDVERKLSDFYDNRGRSPFHLLRLLNQKRSEPEQDFGKAFLANYQKGMADFDKGSKSRAERVIEGEGSDTRMFWTIAPYLYQEAKTEGQDEEETMKRILRWASEGDVNDNLVVHLPGLEFLNDMRSGNAFVLGPNPKGASHSFAQGLAKKIASKMLK